MCHLLGNNDCCDVVAIYAYLSFLFLYFIAFDIVFLKPQVITNIRNSRNIFFSSSWVQDTTVWLKMFGHF